MPRASPTNCAKDVTYAIGSTVKPPAARLAISIARGERARVSLPASSAEVAAATA